MHKKKRLNENHTFLSLCCCLSMKLVVNVISLFFSDKSVPIDGYQGNANPIFISIILILCIIYIFRILIFRWNLRWKMWFFVILIWDFENSSISEWQNQIFQNKRSRFVSYSRDILYNITQYCEHLTHYIHFSRYYIRSRN